MLAPDYNDLRAQIHALKLQIQQYENEAVSAARSANVNPSSVGQEKDIARPQMVSAAASTGAILSVITQPSPDPLIQALPGPPGPSKKKQLLWWVNQILSSLKKSRESVKGYKLL